MRHRHPRDKRRAQPEWLPRNFTHIARLDVLDEVGWISPEAMIAWLVQFNGIVSHDEDDTFIEASIVEILLSTSFILDSVLSR